jgi:hypothetical protein
MAADVVKGLHSGGKFPILYIIIGPDWYLKLSFTGIPLGLDCSIVGLSCNHSLKIRQFK